MQSASRRVDIYEGPIRLLFALRCLDTNIDEAQLQIAQILTKINISREDELLQDGFYKAVHEGEIAFTIMRRLKADSYWDIEVKEGVLYLQCSSKTCGVNPDSAAWKLIHKLQNIPYKTLSDPDWNTYSTTYNLRLPVTPAFVVLPTSVEHVSNAITCAAQYGLKIQAKSGGHSYGSYSNGGSDGAMVIDLRAFQDVQLGSNGIAKVGGGIRLGDLALTLYSQGKRALPHGTCAGVGIGGHFTHGGYGFSSRAWGLSMDQIVGLDVVMPNGRYVYASEDENAELYYAMRGAADSFGIVVNFYLLTRPVPEKVVNWFIDINDAVSSVESAVHAFSYIQSFANDSSPIDRKLGFGIHLGPKRFGVGGTYFGSIEAFNSTIVPALLGGIPVKPSIEAHEVDWLTSLKLLNGGNDLRIGESYSAHSNFFAKSVTVPHPGMSKDALTSYFSYLLNEGAHAPVQYFITVDLYGGTDSQIRTKGPEFSAFSHRDAMWVAQHYGYVDDMDEFPAEGINFINGLNRAMTRNLAEFGAYENYVDPTLTKEEAHALYYGDQLHGKLKALKRKLDPENVFAHPQSI
ncbi:hypothetical protein F5X99DRAFT_412091 [Biscogniauxia marginata]|nr:hypothetical protein F5X99DRAFT_412091 [Biscogniauxia marginata]